MESSTAAGPEHEQLGPSERKLVESAAEHVGDARVLTVFRGQTLVSPAIVPLIGPIVSAFVAKPRSVIVTDRSVITVQESLWFQAQVVRVVSTYPCGSAPMRLTRFGLKIGDDERIFARLGSFAAMKRVANFGSAS